MSENLSNSEKLHNTVKEKITSLEEKVLLVQKYYKQGKSNESELKPDVFTSVGPWENLLINTSFIEMYPYFFGSYFQTNPKSKNFLEEDTINIIVNAKNYFQSFYHNSLNILQDIAGLFTILTNIIESTGNAKISQYNKFNRYSLGVVQVHISNLTLYLDLISKIESEINNVKNPHYIGITTEFAQDVVDSYELPQLLINNKNLAKKLITTWKNILKNLEEIKSISSILNLAVPIVKSTQVKDTDTETDTTASKTAQAKSEESETEKAAANTAKEDWGIKFSYNAGVSSKLSKDDSVEDTTVSSSQKKDFYLQLLPAIKSNLPVSGGSDVPGAMPGVQFRIDNNIVKHKIPGYSPVYQPIGVDSIKCTLVGLFTGHDGVSYSPDFNNRLRDGLFGQGKERSFSVPKKPNVIGGETRVLDYDSFNSAQSFYNEIVGPNKEVEVELNLKKNTGIPGGSTGPFRNPDTGNPLFKAYIKRMDLYYARQDRCWFILDLEITDSGLIGKECINLTNIVDEAEIQQNNAQAIHSNSNTLAELEKCFKNPIDIELKKDGNTGKRLVIDKVTGYHYIYLKDDNKKVLDESRAWPANPKETIQFLANNRLKGTIGKNIKELGKFKLSTSFVGSSENKTVAGFNLRSAIGSTIKVFSLKDNILRSMYYIASLGNPKLTDKINDYTTTNLEAKVFNVTRVLGKNWLYNKNTGYFRVVDHSNNLIGSTKKNLKELLASEAIEFHKIFSHTKMANFITREYLPLLSFPELDCKTGIITNNNNNNNNNQSEISFTEGSAIDLRGLITKSSDHTIYFLNDQTAIPDEIYLLDKDKEVNKIFLSQSTYNGAFNKILQEALNDYFKKLNPDTKKFHSFPLSSNFEDILETYAQNKKKYVKKNTNTVIRESITNKFISRNPNKYVFLTDTEFIREKSNNRNLRIRVLFTPAVSQFSLFDNKNETIFYHNKSYTAEISINKYTDIYNNEKLLIDFIDIQYVNQQSTQVNTASENLQPSASNKPSI